MIGHQLKQSGIEPLPATGTSWIGRNGLEWLYGDNDVVE